MSSVVTIIDYGIGNLFSVCHAVEKVGGTPVVTSNPEEVLKAEKLVLPGVAAFADGMEGLKKRGLIDPIIQYAKSGKPFLGLSRCYK
jgi:glutamine amidotransferase